MTEKRFSQQVVDYARLHGWRVYRVWNSVHSPAGWPDLSMVKGNRLVFAELKRMVGKLTQAQCEWMEALSGTGAEVYVWRPCDWDEIERCVRLWSGKGDLVLDPMSGIGSTGYVALQHGRRFVGCELKPEYWSAAVENLRHARSQLSFLEAE